uniref:LOB domain-containing protein n=1 Tax=Kalanchoe fedtschenkoi TaxID=63787 RepID=A0A7N0T5A9_KALFE
MPMATSSSSAYSSPCAACKFLRRKCLPGCIFAPYFPPEEPQKFANVHKIFGASNVTKLLNELLPHQREDAVNSLAYEAEARVKDPVYGCVGAISFLQRQVQHLQKELDAANADLIRMACSDHHCYHHIPAALPVSAASSGMQIQQQGALNSGFQSNMRQVERSEYGRRSAFGGGGAGMMDHGSSLYQNPTSTGGFNFAFALPWSDSTGQVNDGSLGDQGDI